MDEKQTPSPKTESMTMVNAPSRKQNVACDACRYVVVQSVVDDQRTMGPFSTGVFQSLPFAGAVVFGSENERFLPKAGGLKVENQVSQGEMSSSSRSSKGMSSLPSFGDLRSRRILIKTPAAADSGCCCFVII
ncbi:hypothetical protein FRB91_004819 [Serendipita sp. 411]|nr:hypothetical protein FRC18_005342 [Serendipita sp. 400]KAG8841620.1 hypothetical protein FRB91_004819 [Serendipita sp. 411]